MFFNFVFLKPIIINHFASVKTKLVYSLLMNLKKSTFSSVSVCVAN